MGFLLGTRIRTPEGEKSVQDFRAGDYIINKFGSAAMITGRSRIDSPSIRRFRFQLVFQPLLVSINHHCYVGKWSGVGLTLAPAMNISSGFFRGGIPGNMEWVAIHADTFSNGPNVPGAGRFYQLDGVSSCWANNIICGTS